MVVSRVLLLLVWCVALAVLPALGQQQAVVDHFVGSPGIGSQDGVGSDAHVYNPYGLWTDGTSIYVADSGNDTIRKISLATGMVTTIAGGVQQSLSLDGNGLNARFASLHSIWGDGQSLYVTDVPSLRQIDVTSGAVRSALPNPATAYYAGSQSVAGNSKHLYIFQREYSCGGIVCAGHPIGMYPANITEIDLASGATRQAQFTNGTHPSAFWVDEQFAYTALPSAQGTLKVQKLDLTSFALLPPETIGSASSAVQYTPASLWENGVGLLFASDGSSIYRADPATQTVSLVATPGFSLLGLTGYGNELYASTYSAIVRIDQGSGQMITVAGVAPVAGINRQNIWGDGQFLYVSAGNTIQKISLLTRQISTLAGGFRGHLGIWGHDGFLYVQDSDAQVVYQVDSTSGAKTVIVSGLDGFTQIAGDDQDFYVVRSGPNNSSYIEQISLAVQPSGTALPGTRQTAVFSDGLSRTFAMWSDGRRLFVTDGCTIRKFNLPDNQSTLLAGQSTTCLVNVQQDGVPPNVVFSSLDALWGDGSTLYVVDGSTIRTVDAITGETHTIAGNVKIIGTEDRSGSDARFTRPSGIWGDSRTLYVADSTGFFGIPNGAVRRVTFSSPAGSVPFAVEPNGAAHLNLTSTAGVVATGSAILQPDASGVTPAGVAIFSYRNNGVLVGETAVPATPPMVTGRIFAESSATVRTGVALANPGNTRATVSFYFTDAAGNDFGQGSLTLGANSQVSAFLNEAPFFGSADARTFTFNSTVPIGAIALRGFTNERSDFLMTTLTVAPLSLPSTAPLSAASNAPILIPQFADGGGWQTDLLLVNPTDVIITGTAQFAGSYSYNYSIPPRSSTTFTTPGTATTTVTGAIAVSPATNNYAPVASTMFSFVEGGVTVTQSGIASAGAAMAFRLFAEMGSGPTSLRTGVAIANGSSLPANVQFELFDSSGLSTGYQGSLTLAANGHLSKFINELPGFTGIPVPLQGVLRVTSDQPVTLIGLRGQTNERGEFLIAGTPAIAENTQINGELIFPDLVTGGGYSTELLLVTPGGTASGSVTLAKP
jgi:hypothetical protein